MACSSQNQEHADPIKFIIWEFLPALVYRLSLLIVNAKKTYETHQKTPLGEAEHVHLYLVKPATNLGWRFPGDSHSPHRHIRYEEDMMYKLVVEHDKSAVRG